MNFNGLNSPDSHTEWRPTQKSLLSFISKVKQTPLPPQLLNHPTYTHTHAHTHCAACFLTLGVFSLLSAKKAAHLFALCKDMQPFKLKTHCAPDRSLFDPPPSHNANSEGPILHVTSRLRRLSGFLTSAAASCCSPVF